MRDDNFGFITKTALSLVLLLTFSSSNADLNLELGGGFGEYGNKYKTQHQSVQLMYDLGRFQIGTRVIKRTSDSGAVDSENLTLIQGTYIAGCAAVDITNNTNVQACASEKLWDVETKFLSDPKLFGIQVGAGVSYGNSRINKPSGEPFKRKVLKALLSVERKITSKLTVKLAAESGNNGRSIINDQLKFIVGYKF